MSRPCSRLGYLRSSGAGPYGSVGTTCPSPRTLRSPRCRAGWSTTSGVDASAGMSVLDWLLIPQQRLLGVVAGEAYADGSGAPRQCSQGLVLVSGRGVALAARLPVAPPGAGGGLLARAAEVGDEIGSAVTAARLVRDMMRLALLLERRYAPYQKWLGTAFAGVHHPDGLPEHLYAALRAPEVASRERALAEAYAVLAGRHNAAALTEPVEQTTGTYYGRPARVLMADRFTQACLATVSDPALRGLPPIGSVDQVVDSADVLSVPARYRCLGALYAAGSQAQLEPLV